MIEQVEISSFDLRFEGCRLKNTAAERILLSSIAEKGIQEPLQGVDTREARILLDGFKRYRCALKLSIGIAPYYSLAGEEGTGIVKLLRLSNAKNLSILEQAKLVDELQSGCHMSCADIANLLEKSKAWVSVRSGIIKDMSSFVMEKIFAGQFPAYTYMYVLRPFMRINKVPLKDVDEFVKLVAGKNLSLRDLELLANAYFKGSDEIRRQMKEGDILWALNSLKETTAIKNEAVSSLEQAMITDLKIVKSKMNRVALKSQDTRYKSGAFFAQANLLSGGILKQMDIFREAVKELYDKSGKT